VDFLPLHLYTALTAMFRCFSERAWPTPCIDGTRQEIRHWLLLTAVSKICLLLASCILGPGTLNPLADCCK